MRRILLLLPVVAVLAAGCGAAEDPTITAYAAGRAVTVAPAKYCDIGITTCSEPGGTASLPVPAGQPLQLSLPAEIADAPWRLLAVYRDADGNDRGEEQLFSPGDRRAVTVAPENGTDQLEGVEITLPSAVVDTDGQPYIRAFWSISTDPARVGPADRR